MKHPIIYIVLNGELNMSPGKAAAQAVHASMTLTGESKFLFSSVPKRTVIVLEAKNSDQLKNLEEYLGNTDIDADYYIDEGVNEVGAYSVTALAAGPIESDDEEMRAIFESFELFSGTIKVYGTDKKGHFSHVDVPNYTEIEDRSAFAKLKKELK
jgi:peptidyl-tRNA hydrolase